MSTVIFLLIVVITACLILGRIDIVLIGGAGLLLLLSAILVLFFSVCLVRLIFMRRREAHFTRIGFADEKGWYEVAFYDVDGTEYPCIFPEEGIFRSYFYNPKRRCHVFLNERNGRLFDPISLITIIFGFFAGIAFGVLVYLLFFFR